MRLRASVLCALGLVAVSANAADETGKWYVTPQSGYLWTDNDRNVEDDAYYGLGIGKHISPEWSLELNGVKGRYDVAPGTKLDISAFSLDALRVFKRSSVVSPFLSIGAGFIQDDPRPGSSEGSPLAQVGAGLLIDVAENASKSFVFQLRPEVKARWDFIDLPGNSSFLDYSAGVGFQLAWGAGRTPDFVVVSGGRRRTDDGHRRDLDQGILAQQPRDLDAGRGGASRGEVLAPDRGGIGIVVGGDEEVVGLDDVVAGTARGLEQDVEFAEDLARLFDDVAGRGDDAGVVGARGARQPDDVAHTQRGHIGVAIGPGLAGGENFAGFLLHVSRLQRPGVWGGAVRDRDGILPATVRRAD